MEQGAKAVLRILIAAMLLGAVVIVAHPQYRETARAILHGHPEMSPIWKSNGAYYSEIEVNEGSDDHAE
jgi:hypothetical protein